MAEPTKEANEAIALIWSRLDTEQKQQLINGGQTEYHGMQLHLTQDLQGYILHGTVSARIELD